MASAKTTNIVKETVLVREIALKPHHQIVQLLRNGKPVKMSILTERLGSDIAHKFPIHLYAIKQNGGMLRVYKTGHTVNAIQLLNPKSFDRYGQPTQAVKTDGKVQPVTRSEVILQPNA